QAPPDPLGHRVVDGRVTQGTGDPEPLDMSVRRDVGLHADDGGAPQELHCGGGAREVRAPEEPGGQPLRIDLEPDSECGSWGDSGLDDLIQVERIGPEGLVAKRPMPKDELPFGGEVERWSVLPVPRS